MLKSREQLEEQEGRMLAPFAQKSRDSAGRLHPEPRHPFRTEYQRDRERVIHSRSFRRLEYKTQVFLNGTGDHLRTRLTHTIEVTSLSRAIARALGLNEDLAETISLAHDLGHPPFGHSGEEMLNRLMNGHGGFEHNGQSLRIVEVLERKYPQFPGLNLSFEVIEGLNKHALRTAAKSGDGFVSPSLEAQVADIADEITYYSHDLDDGLDFDLITLRQLRELEVWGDSHEEARAQFPGLKGRDLAPYVIRCIIDREVQDVIQTSAAKLARARLEGPADARRMKTLIGYSPGLRQANRKLRKFLYDNLYYHPRVAGVNNRACELLESLFKACLRQPKLIGRSCAVRVTEDGLHRAVCDYISGMTDRYLIGEHARVFGQEQAPGPLRNAHPAVLTRMHE